MGMAKDMMMAQQEQGWAYTDQFVCAACVEDDALRDAIRGAEEPDGVCDFCEATPAALLDVLMEAFVSGLRNEYNSADDEFIPYESREGGYQFFASPGYDSWDLVGEFGDVLVGDGLVDAVRASMQEQMWVKRDYVWRDRDTVLRDAWTAFGDAVKYRTRYVIWLVENPDEDELRGTGEVPAAMILHDIGRLLDELDVVRTLPSGTAVWRAQTHNGPKLSPNSSAKRLGTGRREHAKQPNRMSPAGIPMFYGAQDRDTAIAEVAIHADADRDHVTFGQFAFASDITVVDLTALPPTPSMFDPRFGRYRREIAFLHEFVGTLSIPVAPGDEAIDYVPTQVMTEYFLRVFRPESGEDVVGLVYYSAAWPGGVSLVLDVPNERCVDVGDPVTDDGLVLDPATVEVTGLTAP